MHRTIPAAIVAICAVTGCTRVVEVQVAPEDTTVSTSAPRATAAPAPASTLTIADSVRELADIPIYLTDMQIENLAVTICESLDSGYTLDEVAQMAVDAAAGDADTQTMFAAITVVAIMDLCPHHEWMLQQLST